MSPQKMGLLHKHRMWVEMGSGDQGLRISTWDTFESRTCTRCPSKAARWVAEAEETAGRLELAMRIWEVAAHRWTVKG